MKNNFTHPNTIYFSIGFLFFLLICFLHLSCGFKASGGTTHRVEGEAVVTVKFDMSICDGLDEVARQECVLAILEILKKQEDAT